MADAIAYGHHVLNEKETRCKHCGKPVPDEGFGDEQCKSNELRAAGTPLALRSPALRRRSRSLSAASTPSQRAVRPLSHMCVRLV